MDYTNRTPYEQSRIDRRAQIIKRQVELKAQLKAYAAAHKEARKNGTPRPNITDFVTNFR